jgi:hypothetical protein
VGGSRRPLLAAVRPHCVRWPHWSLGMHVGPPGAL